MGLCGEGTGLSTCFFFLLKALSVSEWRKEIFHVNSLEMKWGKVPTKCSMVVVGYICSWSTQC